MSRRRGEGRKRVGALEAEVRILAGELETHRLLIDRLTVNPEKIASKITEAVALVRGCDFTTVPPADDDLPPGVTSVAELMTGSEYRAMDEEMWGKWDAPTVSYTKAEEAAFAEIWREYADGGQS